MPSIPVVLGSTRQGWSSTLRRDVQPVTSGRPQVQIFRAVLIAGSLSGGFLMSSCGGDTVSAPSPTALVTFAVQSETFRVSLTNSEQLAAARAAQRGGRARIPIGRIASGAQVNTGWSWHLEELTFAEATIELCDGRPSDVERQGTQFGGGRFCPWSATIVRIDEQ
jgi:hypothetical protein